MDEQQYWPDQRRMDAMPFTDSVEFAALDCSPGFARGWAASRLAEWGLGELSYSAGLVISELVTNSFQATSAVTWTGPVPPLRLYLHAGPLPLGVYVLVQDAVVLLPRWPRPGEVADLLAESGRGLSMMLPEYADEWGAHLSAEPGKVTWALVTCPG